MNARMISGLVMAMMLASGASAQQARRGAAASPAIPDGRYTCQMWMGNSYVTLASTLAGGAASSTPLAKVGATITGVTRTATGITIAYTTARGYRESMDCKRV